MLTPYDIGIFQGMLFQMPTNLSVDLLLCPNSEPPQKSSSSTGAIIGGVIGGVALITICVAGWIFVRRRRTAELQSNPDLHGFEDPPVLTQNNGSLRPATVPPAWGYVTTPYVSEENRNSSTSPHHRKSFIYVE